jgi:putative transposase
MRIFAQIIERWFQTLKYEEVYLNDYANIRDARNKIGNFINTYKWVRHHSAIDYKSPASLYYGALQQAA